MKKIFYLLILVALTSSVFAQKMRKVDEPDLGMKYTLPKDWQIDRFGSTDWDDFGGAVCKCSGIINIGDHFGNEEIFMVIYPAQSEDSLNAIKRLYVWDMKFDVKGIKSEIKAGKLTFDKMISRFSLAAGALYSDNEVWQLKTRGEGQFYLFYIWAKPEVMKKNEATIQKILEAFVPVKVKRN